MRHVQMFSYAILQRQQVRMVPISLLALRLLFILSMKYGITNSVPATITIPLDSAALDILKTSRLDT